MFERLIADPQGGGGLTQFQLLEESGHGTQLTPHDSVSRGTLQLLQCVFRLSTLCSCAIFTV